MFFFERVNLGILYFTIIVCMFSVMKLKTVWPISVWSWLYTGGSGGIPSKQKWLTVEEQKLPVGAEGGLPSGSAPKQEQKHSTSLSDFSPETVPLILDMDAS